jgi:hypothetical protein
MGKELIQNNEEKRPANGMLEPTDDLADIDPADFVDPEEFGFRRLHIHE